MHTDRDGYARAGEAMLATGTTAYQPTFITAPEDDLVAGAARDAAGARRRPVRDRRARRGAVHLAARGSACTRRRAQRAPDPALLERLLDAGGVTQVTLAPELPGAFELIDLLLERGVVVSAGHTDASAAEAHLAFDRGVRTVTHLFNAMRPLVPRDPGIGLAALARPDVTVQLIADGHHVARRHACSSRGRRRAGGSRSSPTRSRRRRWATATSRSRAAGSCRPSGVVRGPEGQLAGSVLTMIDAVRNVHALGVPLEEALRRGLDGAGADRRAAGPRPARARRAGRRRRARRQPGDRRGSCRREATVSLAEGRDRRAAGRPSARVLADAERRRDRRRRGGDRRRAPRRATR